MRTNARKLLIIGSANYEKKNEGMRIDCVTWGKLTELENVSDYDLLLINLLGLKTDAERKKVDWARFQAFFNFVATTDILAHDGEIVVLGDPRFSIPHWMGNDKQRAFFYWTGIMFNWDAQPGDTIKYAPYGVDDFTEFRRHFRYRNYSLRNATPDEGALTGKWNMANLRDRCIRPKLKRDDGGEPRGEKQRGRMDHR